MFYQIVLYLAVITASLPKLLCLILALFGILLIETGYLLKGGYCLSLFHCSLIIFSFTEVSNAGFLLSTA